MTPEACAASMRRRVALRSSALGVPQTSLTTAATAGQRAASTAARRVAVAARARTSSTRAGSSPSAPRPSADSAPISRRTSPGSVHTMVVAELPAMARAASAAAKPRAAAASASPSATISCRAARSRPPPAAASIPAWPSSTRLEPAWRAAARLLPAARISPAKVSPAGPKAVRPWGSNSARADPGRAASSSAKLRRSAESFSLVADMTVNAIVPALF
jgi:hypothetical protein